MSNQINLFENGTQVKTHSLQLPKLHFFADPGHGWLKVPKKLLLKLGIADKISRFSYQLNDSAYLEEDSDLTIFVEALQSKYGAFSNQEFWDNVKSNHTDNLSRIRNYKSYVFYSGKDLERVTAKRKKVLKAQNFNQKAINEINNAPETDLDYWIKFYKLK
jgi:hypothetical protein